ncbi:hypothetical protein [Rhizobium lentis]|uniref:hypothetical protein n=1 Tax=Rhizobium lentis TaxID=1138194 RepID=UPI001A924EC9|nr:hypothetical protein [Rhizobium lentis]MBX5001456.1 hypothetical protein [Rhizobium lentis]MBX5019771.1 hypothetical protein [Rhizobium lentis]MBX5065667.1 hypothetical protein [Rhizobium lentis]MBX5078720.1 hypothetical protein [Rhizobium lentis]QSW91717.1 hypothetical protein J0663_11255 [Rhizobium lentis]
MIVVAFFSWEVVRRDEWWSGDPDIYADLPVRCENVKGTADVDYALREAPEPWNAYRTPGFACWYTEHRFRQLFPSYASISHAKLGEMLYENLGWESVKDRDKFERTKPLLMGAFLPPFGQSCHRRRLCLGVLRVRAASEP